jgi:hypothetical protein
VFTDVGKSEEAFAFLAWINCTWLLLLFKLDPQVFFA